jgi:hypothetical protein
MAEVSSGKDIKDIRYSCNWRCSRCIIDDVIMQAMDAK